MLRPPRQELRSLLVLAIPVVIAELGWVAMGVVDTLMVGRLGDSAIGAVGLGRALFFGVAVFGIGLLLGLDTVISNSYGAGNLERCRSALWHGVLLAVVISFPLTLLIRFLGARLGVWGVDSSVLGPAMGYTKAVSWAALPIYLYSSVRRYLQAMDQVVVVMIALVSANAVNILANWILIFGNLGAPAMGVRGAAFASVISMSYMALFLGIAAWLHASRLDLATRFRWTIDREMTARLVYLGLPAAFQLLLEVGVFCLSQATCVRVGAGMLRNSSVQVRSVDVFMKDTA